MVDDISGNTALVAYATLIVAIGTIGALFVYWYYFRQQNIIAKNEINYYAMLEIMKIFNNTENNFQLYIFNNNNLFK